MRSLTPTKSKYLILLSDAFFSLCATSFQLLQRLYSLMESNVEQKQQQQQEQLQQQQKQAAYTLR